MNKSGSAAESGAAISEREAESLFSLFPKSAPVVLAASGGGDSTALLVLAARWRGAQSSGPALHAATIDHALRPQSRTEAELIGALCQSLDVPHAILNWAGEKPSSGVEAAARDARRGLLTAHARSLGAAHIATAHTLDDQAETVLMRLAAGSGPAGLAAMRMREKQRDMTWLRPFLGIRKQRLIATLQGHGIGWSEDPMNRDARFERPRLRAAAGVLAREGLTPERLGRLAERMARYETIVAGCADAAREALRPTTSGRWDGHALLALPEELALRLLGMEIAACAGGGGTRRDHPIRLQRLEALWRDLSLCLKERRANRRSLAGALISVLPDGSLTITREPARHCVRRKADNSAS
ncbi:MAG TPA: tRNA lysidine(34) synthetase TilS [Xanthobacteraceae bacterium]